MPPENAKVRFNKFLDSKGVLPDDRLRKITQEQLGRSNAQELLDAAIARSKQTKQKAAPELEPKKKASGLGSFDRLKRAKEVIEETERIKRRQK